MAKAYITRQEKLNSDLAAWIYGTMKVKRISQGAMAENIGIKQPSLNYKLKHYNFTYQDLVVLFRELQPDAETIARLMGAEEWMTKG